MDGGSVEVLEAMAAFRAAERATARSHALHTELERSRAAIDGLRTRLQGEERDVERLTGLSIASVIASLRGRREEAIGAERAEADGVRLELAVRLEAHAALERDAADCATAAAELPATRDALGRALQAREAALRSQPTPVAAELTRLGDAAGQLHAELRECDEALHAAAGAARALEAAAADLQRAGNWSTYDTFFGGGFIAGTIKHDRLRDAAGAVAAAQHALSRLHAELHDLAMPSGTAVQLPSEALRTMDVWFDNLISDWMVHDRINASKRSVTGARQGVAHIDTLLQQRRHEAAARLADVDARRLALLTGDAPERQR